MTQPALNAPKPFPPRPVVIAVVLLAAGMLFGLVRSLQILQPMAPAPLLTLVYVVLAVGYVVLAALLFAIWRGYNWARWVCAAMTLLGLARAVQALTSSDSAWLALETALPPLVQIVAMALLFVRASDAWFKRRKAL